MILINGDSWGCGELINIDGHCVRQGERKVVHGGLAEYFCNNSLSCINLSSIGSTNLESLDRLEIFLIANQHLIEKITKIYFFQTEWSRDIISIDYKQKKYEELKLFCLHRFYSALSNIAQNYNVTIDLIGGCSDVSDLCLQYPKLNIACKSMYSLVTQQNTDDVYDLFLDRTILDYIDKQEYQLSLEDKEKISYDLDQANIRLESFKSHQTLFYPDGYHANRRAHKILYDLLIGNVA